MVATPIASEASFHRNCGATPDVTTPPRAKRRTFRRHSDHFNTSNSKLSGGRGCASPDRSINTSWGSSVHASLKPSLRRSGPRHGEALDFGSPLRGGRSAEVAVAGLKLFITERLGGLRNAFNRMDFHRDGKVSCLEFQEILSGQEHYCSLQEARELFCLLARGTSGALTYEDFLRRLGSCGDQAGDWEGSASWSCASSESSRLAGNALRALLMGQSALNKSGDPDGEVDDAATTVQSLTSRSSQSATAGMGGRHSAGRRLAERSEAEVDQLLASDRSKSEMLARSLLEGAMRDSRHVTESGASMLNVGVQNRKPSAVLNKLDEGLLALRAEVAALQALGGPVAKQELLVSTSGATDWAEASLPATSQVQPQEERIRQYLMGDFSTAQDVEVLPERSDQQTSHPSAVPSGPRQGSLQPRSVSGGLSWIGQLPQQIQGRLAACVAPAEALEALDEALAGLPKTSSSASSSHKDEHPLPHKSNQSSNLVKEASPALLAAAMGLLQAAKDKVSRLEATLKTRRQSNAEEVRELRQRLREERRRSLRHLFARLAPPPSLLQHPSLAQRGSHGGIPRSSQHLGSEIHPSMQDGGHHEHEDSNEHEEEG
eukprot:TRINITY_DN37282_c0_g1_i1.p1 TRINITY_DN37282_c0_g1~~TRINITY_DN37282_c0_g1_i1.p1  ORF type:complete len:612 (-),score=127.12 TRINITY_DN37282_c0_g1_i1:121-1929(-)